MTNWRFETAQVIKIIFLLFFIALCFLPMLQMKFNFISNVQFDGVENKTELPKFSWDSFLQDKFQQKFNSWLAANIGFRAEMIKLDNQIAFSFLNHVNTKYGTGIVLGKDHYLYEQQYIDAYLGKDFVGQEKIKEAVRNLSLLESLLNKHNVRLLLLVGGNKASFFPEYLPQEYQEQKIGISNHRALVNLLAEAKIPFIDTSKVLSEQKSEKIYPLYPKSGTHWSYYGACFLTIKIRELIGDIFKKELPFVSCDNLKIKNEPMGNDSDIAGITNIWSISSFFDAKLAYPVRPKEKPVGFRPKVAWIGDSFSWQPLQYLRMFRLYQEIDLYYYFRSITKHSFISGDRKNGFFYELPSQSFSSDKLDFKNNFLNKDLIIIQVNEAAISMLGYGFIEYALSNLND